MSEGITADVAEERLNHHSIKPEVAPRAKLLDSNGHCFMTGSGLSSVGTEEAVPPGQIKPKIAIGLTRENRVVDAVHVRRHNEPAQNAVHPARDANVGVIKY